MHDLPTMAEGILTVSALDVWIMDGAGVEQVRMDMGKNQVTVTGTMDANVSSNRVVDRRIGGRIGELGKRSEEQHARGTGVAR